MLTATFFRFCCQLKVLHINEHSLVMASSFASAVRYLGQPADPLKVSVDQLRSHVEEMASSMSSMQSTLHSVRSVVNAFEREFPDVLRQLDILAGQLDREKGDVAVLKEQLAFLANGGGRFRNDGGVDANASRGLYAVLLSMLHYLYNPFLYLIHGLYILLAPVLTTFRCLSIFRGAHAKDEISDDEDDAGNLYGSAMETHQMKNEVGYLLMALANNGSDKIGNRGARGDANASKGVAHMGGKLHGGTTTTEPQTPQGVLLSKATPQRGTELFTLLQQTRIDSRTVSSKKEY
jgi:hypothetical protein